MKKLNKINIRTIINFFVVFVIIFAPFIIFAEDSLIPCGRVEQTTGGGAGMCEFYDLIKLINNFINYFIMIAIPITTGVIVYAGFLLMSSAGNEKKREEAKEMFQRVVTGLIIMLAAFTIVHEILANIADTKGYIDLLGINKK